MVGYDSNNENNKNATGSTLVVATDPPSAVVTYAK